ncbi:MAG: HAD-IC family P-type ATPase [Candidatus Magasanikbacteria bacterium]
MDNFYLQSIPQILKFFNTHQDGLSTTEVKEKQKKYGFNKLPRSGEKVSRFKIFLNQWKSPLIIILIVAGIISGFLGEYIDTSVIFITVFVNAIVGFIQEDKANQSLKKLREMVEYSAIVIRSGRRQQINSTEIVPGDILVLEAGDKIQADGRIIENINFNVDESALTGESEPVEKNSNIIKKEVGIADRDNMAFRSTVVSSGRAKIIVTAIGGETEIGRISSMVKKTEDEKTPLQIQLSKMGKVIGIVVLFISLAIFLLGVFSKSEHHTFVEMFETAVAVAVAAIPEGLVISMTVILAVGMQHILKRKALVRKLVSAETLGSVSVICTDKTGTLTEGKMRITRLITSNDDLNFSELKAISIDEEERHPDAFLGLRIGILCNDGILQNPEALETEWKFVGDTTDIGFIYAGMKVGLEKYHLDPVLRRVAEIPFESDNKFMATLHHIDHESLLYVKGAAEMLYSKCSYYIENGKEKKLSKSKLAWFKAQEEELTKKGLRVLALAYQQKNELINKLEKKDLKNLVLVGLVALSDPLRADVKDSIQLTKQAGIRTVMITGDHIRTAQSIAGEVGIPHDDDQIFDGQKLESLSDEDLQMAVRDIYIFARVDPRHKIRIVRAFQANGEVVAMTGDGVNDAPALKGADIGVAMVAGTDVAKEISDMVLLDNHFATIVSAVEEGRGIYQNIKKVIVYLLAGSLSEVFLIAGSIIAGLPLALLPAQVLWMNLVQEGIVVMSLGFDKGDKENMTDKPRKRNTSIIDKEMKVTILIVTIVPNIVLFGLFLYYMKTTGDIALVRTLMFVGIGIGALFYIFSIRSMRKMVWQISLVSNHYLVYALIVSWALLIGSIYLKPLQILLRTVPLSLHYWIVMILFGLLNLVLIEIIKGIFLIKNRKHV